MEKDCPDAVVVERRTLLLRTVSVLRWSNAIRVVLALISWAGGALALSIGFRSILRANLGPTLIPQVAIATSLIERAFVWRTARSTAALSAGARR